jgi:threonine/homoserine/homoserine lactone efflux protein
MIAYLLQGIGYGFVGAAQPGPFQAFIISQTLRIGWRRGLPAAFAPLISDGPIIVLVVLVLNQVPASMVRLLHFASAAFLAYLAWGAFRRCRGSPMEADTRESGQQGLLKAVLMNLLNPSPYIYWSLVAGPTFLAGWRSAPVNGIGFLAGFYATLVGTLAAIIVVFGVARRLGPQLTRTLLGASAIALVCFAAYQLRLGLEG